MAIKPREIFKIDLNKIFPDPNQPRKWFDNKQIEELGLSIKSGGQAVPISVRKHPDLNQIGMYMINVGERRWRASKLIEASTIDAIVEELTDDELFLMQINENKGQAGLTRVEEAESYQRRLDSLKERDIPNPFDHLASELGMGISWLSKKMSVLKLHPEIRVLAHNGKIKSYGLLKKLSELDEDRRNNAITLINEGTFNSVEFFATKKKGTPLDTLDKPKKPKQIFRLSFSSPNQCHKLFDSTSFKDILEQGSPDWRNADEKQMKFHLKQFIDWLTADELPDQPQKN